MGDIGPGADMGDARHQRVNIPVQPVQMLQLAGHPVLFQLSIACQLGKNPAEHHQMAIGHGLPKIGNLRDIP